MTQQVNVYDFGSQVICESGFTTPPPASVPTDPTTVTLRIMNPAGVEQVVAMGSMTHVSAGVFTFAVTCLVAGVWTYRFEGTGALVAVQDVNFVITSSIFPDAAS